VTPGEVEAFRRDGAVVLRGLCKDWVEVIAAGIERNMREPSQHAMESVKPGEPGRFFDDYCNWERIPEFRRVIEESPIAQAAAAAMKSSSAQFFHDDPDNDPSMRVLEWQMEPGDAVLFDFRTVHGAHGNPHGKRRRVLSLRWVGDDAVYVERPGRTSPPFPGHDMTAGQKLREDWFPVLWRG